LRADGDADDAVDFTRRLFRVLLRACEERGWRVELRALEEDAETSGVRRAALTIDGSTGDVAVG
jgi:protein subunit release factor B